MASQWTRKNVFHDIPLRRSGAGAMPPSASMRFTVFRPITWPRFPEHLTLLCQSPALAVVELPTLRPELSTQHAVLLAQILDRGELTTVHPAADRQQEKVESGRLHEG